jgi:hypothetical protein
MSPPIHTRVKVFISQFVYWEERATDISGSESDSEKGSAYVALFHVLREMSGVLFFDI